MTITLAAISSALYAAASLCTARARRRCTLIADIAVFRPFPGWSPMPMALMPSDAQGPEPIPRPYPDPPMGDRIVPTAAEDSPDAARTAKSDASSISWRIIVTERNTPGSMGGGVGLPEPDTRGSGGGGGGGGNIKDTAGGDGGGERSRDGGARCFPDEMEGRDAGGLGRSGER